MFICSCALVFKNYSITGYYRVFYHSTVEFPFLLVTVCPLGTLFERSWHHSLLLFFFILINCTLTLFVFHLLVVFNLILIFLYRCINFLNQNYIWLKSGRGLNLTRVKTTHLTFNTNEEKKTSLLFFFQSSRGYYPVNLVNGIIKYTSY